MIDDIRLVIVNEGNGNGAFFEISQADEKVQLTLDEIVAIYHHASKMIQDYDAKTDNV